MANREPSVFIVDDDTAILQSLSWLLESVGLKAECFVGGREFLDAYRPEWPGCVLLDIRMPGMSGLELQARLGEMEPRPPVIIVTGHGDVPMAARAMRAGALDFIEKPFSDQVLLDRIHDALGLDARRRERYAKRAAVAAQLDALTPRERQVMELVVEGRANRQIAKQLGLSEKTIETHRASVMEKTQADSLPDLVRMVLTLQEASAYSLRLNGAA